MKTHLDIRSSALELLASLMLLTGCENQGGPDSVLPDAQNGPNGETVGLTGLVDGAAMRCTPVSADVWSFTVNYSAQNLAQPGRVQLLVEVDKDSSGEDVWGSNRGPYVQLDSATIAGGTASGTLRGFLGPPVSANVRFNLALRLVDASGNLIAVSPAVSGLQPATN